MALDMAVGRAGVGVVKGDTVGWAVLGIVAWDYLAQALEGNEVSLA